MRERGRDCVHHRCRGELGVPPPPLWGRVGERGGCKFRGCCCPPPCPSPSRSRVYPTSTTQYGAEPRQAGVRVGDSWLSSGFSCLDQCVGDAHATAPRADEDRVEVDRRERAVGRGDELAETHAAIDERIDVARRRAAKAVEELRDLQRAERGL